MSDRWQVPKPRGDETLDSYWPRVAASLEEHVASITRPLDATDGEEQAAPPATPEEYVERIALARIAHSFSGDVLRLSCVIAHEAGVPVTRIAAAAGVSRPTIYAWIEAAPGAEG